MTRIALGIALLLLSGHVACGGKGTGDEETDDPGGDTDADSDSDADSDADADADADTDADSDGDADTDADSDADADTDADSDTATGAACEGSGVWSDSTTGLCWQNPGPEATATLQQAITYCGNLSLAGYDDWHLPNIDELRSLIRGCPDSELGGACPVTDGDPWTAFDDATRSGCDLQLGPGTDGCYWDPALTGDCVDYWHWSSSVTSDIPNWVWAVGFSAAPILGSIAGSPFYTRCVRGVMP